MQKTYKKYALIFLLPVLIAFLVAFVIPLIMGIYLSFCQFKTISSAKFVGFSNYVKVFTDFDGFLSALWFTVKVAFVGVITSNVVAFSLALILTRSIRGKAFYRTIFFMPNLIGGIVLGYIWQLLLNGILISLTGADLTNNSVYGYWGLIILYNWQKDGYLMVVYMAGIMSIPHEIIESARIDGASFLQTLRRIIIPLVMPSITICAFLSLKDTFMMYDQNLSLTGGLPANKTAMVAMDIYSTFYKRTGFAGIGQAKSVIFTILVFVIVFIQLIITRRKEVDM